MDNNEESAVLESEEIPDEFECCVCLDIMYKPVVLACGHISCFWCVYQSMDTFQESHCPVCRNPYNHFPSICKLLHFLLLKLYPSAYKRRESQVAEEERKYGHASPQFDDDLLDSCSRKVIDIGDSSSQLLRTAIIESNTTCGSEDSFVQGSPKRTFSGEDNVSTFQTTLSSQSINDLSGQEICVVERRDKNETFKQFLLSDLQCAVCKQLLYHPVVLNCGHVYCEACINKPHDNVFRCPVCQSAHPNAFPNVCLVLEHFLEKHFSKEYSARQESVARFQSASPSGCSKDNKDNAGQYYSVPTNVYSTWWSSLSSHGPKVHPRVGCDYCGMCPIIGQRYKCNDCIEKMGFDLCEACYNSSSKLPGRFNQQHTQEHKFTVVEAPNLQNLILSIGTQPYEEYSIGVGNPDNPEEDIIVPGMSSNSSGETAASLTLSDDGPQEVVDVMASPDSLNNCPENQGGDHPAT